MRSKCSARFGSRRARSTELLSETGFLYAVRWRKARRKSLSKPKKGWESVSTTVHLIEHGRVDATAPPAILPSHLMMHWLGPLGDVTAGLSYAFLNGRLAVECGTSDPGGSIERHYLCGEHADEDAVVDTKIKTFFLRQTPDPHGSGVPSNNSSTTRIHGSHSSATSSSNNPSHTLRCWCRNWIILFSLLACVLSAKVTF
jgi:hypothetical protein